MSDTAVAKQAKFELEYQATGGTVRLNPTIVRKYLVHGRSELVTDTEIVLFMNLCRYQGLNPFLRECYLIKYSSSDPATMVTGKDTFTKRAASIPVCEGYNAGIIVRRKVGTGVETVQRVGSNVQEGEELVGGWAKAYRKGWKEPVQVEVSLKEYMRYSAKGEPTRSWREMPASMIRKVALVQVLREAFPDHYSNLYSPEEMPIDESRLPTEPIPQPPAEKLVERSATPEPQPPQGEGGNGKKTDTRASEAKDSGLNTASAEAGKKPDSEGKRSLSSEKELDIF